MFLASKMLFDRAQMMAAVRNFFAARAVLEVDTPLLGQAAPVDAHIDILTTQVKEGTLGYLHSSPEYAMKKLLAQGSGDIYQMGHVFRYGEIGRLHNPEFTMIEWYRIGIDYEKLIEETLELIALFLPNSTTRHLSYKAALQEYAHIDPASATHTELLAAIDALNLNPPVDYTTWEHDTLLQFLMSFAVEPELQQLTVIKDYPASQAALAQTKYKDGYCVAERFEIYYQGIELANGFHELTDAVEQRKRLLLENQKRRAMGKSQLPIDEEFLAALASGIPDACGVAVGFDRLMLLKHRCQSLAEIAPFTWSH